MTVEKSDSHARLYLIPPLQLGRRNKKKAGTRLTRSLYFSASQFFMEWLSKITSRAARRLNRPKASAKLHNPLHITKLFDEKIWHKKREHHRNHTQTPYNQQIIKNNFFRFLRHGFAE